ncbi:MAG: hypothetical protein ABJB11_13705 [Ferruginibacter sp.]
MPKYIICIIVILFVASCQNKKKVEVKSMNDLPYSLDSLKRKILNKGDTNSYHALRIIYLDHPSENLLFWALIMANKFQYSQAYYDVYYTLLVSSKKINDSDINMLDDQTKNMALRYLNLAAQKGDMNAIDILKDNPLFVIKSSPVRHK